MNIVHAVWEKENLGVDAYEVFLDADDTADYLRETEQQMIKDGAQYIVVKTPVNRGDLLFELPQIGYTYVETLFRIAIERRDYLVPDSIARFDRGLAVLRRENAKEQSAVFKRIKEGVFRSDRISLDPYFDEGTAANRYINWMKQMLDQGSKLYEVLHQDEPIGFFIIKQIDAQTVDPVLMGLYNEDQNRGLGTLLHKKTLDTCFLQDCSRITSTFVSNNAKILRVYANVGAAITDVLYTYVKHI